MLSFLPWCAIVVLMHNKHADSFSISHCKRNAHINEKKLSNSCRQTSCASSALFADSGRLSALSDEVIEIVKKRSPQSGLTNRPGFTFGLGCDNWDASDFSGSIEGWDSEPAIRWVSRSLLKQVPYVQKSDSQDSTSAAEDASAQPIQTRLDMHFSVGSLLDIPHMRITISETKKGYSLLVDYIPRLELLNSLDYFDKYFENVEGSIDALTASGFSEGIFRHRNPTSVLSKLLLSPFSLSIETDLKNHEIVKELCLDYTKRWCMWLVRASIESEKEKAVAAASAVESASKDAGSSEEEIEKNKVLLLENNKRLLAMYDRDQRIQKLSFEEQKYELAKVMGSDFAPKAAELAAAIIGPSIGAASYNLY